MGEHGTEAKRKSITVHQPIRLKNISSISAEKQSKQVIEFIQTSIFLQLSCLICQYAMHIVNMLKHLEVDCRLKVMSHRRSITASTSVGE